MSLQYAISEVVKAAFLNKKVVCIDHGGSAIDALILGGIYNIATINGDKIGFGDGDLWNVNRFKLFETAKLGLEWQGGVKVTYNTVELTIKHIVFGEVCIEGFPVNIDPSYLKLVPKPPKFKAGNFVKLISAFSYHKTGDICQVFKASADGNSCCVSNKDYEKGFWTQNAEVVPFESIKYIKALKLYPTYNLVGGKTYKVVKHRRETVELEGVLEHWSLNEEWFIPYQENPDSYKIYVGTDSVHTRWPQFIPDFGNSSGFMLRMNYPINLCKWEPYTSSREMIIHSLAAQIKDGQVRLLSEQEAEEFIKIYGLPERK